MTRFYLGSDLTLILNRPFIEELSRAHLELRIQTRKGGSIQKITGDWSFVEA